MKKKRNQGNRLLAMCMALLLAFSMLFSAVGTTENVQAASNGLNAYKKITFYKSGKVNGTTYSRGEGPADSIIGCDGTYLYMGYQTQYGDGLGNFAVVNLKKRQIKRLGKDCSTVQSVKNKVLVTAVGFPHGGPVYLINRDGSKCKIISDRAIKVSVKGNYIYYTEATYDWKTRKCRCDLNGNNKKALTAWSRGIAG